MEYDELKHFEKLLDEFEEDALAAALDNSNTPSASKCHQRDLTRRNVLVFVENIVIQRDHLVDKLSKNSKLVSVVAQAVATP